MDRHEIYLNVHIYIYISESKHKLDQRICFFFFTDLRPCLLKRAIHTHSVLEGFMYVIKSCNVQHTYSNGNGVRFLPSKFIVNAKCTSFHVFSLDSTVEENNLLLTLTTTRTRRKTCQ